LKAKYLWCTWTLCWAICQTCTKAKW